MTLSWRRVGLALWVLALVWAAVLLGLHLRSAAAPPPRVLTPQQLANGFAGSTIAPVRLPPSGAPLSGGAAPAISLTGVGGPGTLAAYRGDVTLVTFVNPACQGSCYGTVAVIDDALRSLGPVRAHVAVLVVDVAGSRMPAAQLQAWWAASQLGRPGALLTGSVQAVKAVLKSYGIVVDRSKHGLVWTPALYVLNGRGQGQRLFILNANQELSEAAALRRAIRLSLPRAR
jgi:cytochrome oxidase Cu insertion factor (SCO1/SenC/PrrC family)